MIDLINQSRHEHIITIEDPIEFIQLAEKVPGERARGPLGHLLFFQRAACRSGEDPDVVLIGEMRDLETIEAALRIAETGHLTFATLHTNWRPPPLLALLTFSRCTNNPKFAPKLSMVLEGIVCQSLLPRADGRGRTVAREILIPNPAIRNLIREDKIHQVYSAMQLGQEKFGMQTLNQSLYSLYAQRLISLDTALTRTSHLDELQDMINRGGAAGGGGQPTSVLHGSMRR